MLEQNFIEHAQKKKKWTFIIIVILFLNLLSYTSGFKIAKIGSFPLNGTSISPMKEKNIKITQSNKDWNEIKDLDIFYNSGSNNKVIAPETAGSYTFQVENTLKNDILCNMKINETNEYNINMKCKLKRDNIYILGNENTWIDIEELFVDSITVAKNKSDFTLEWYWESSDNDTEIGKTEGAEYKLNINIYSTQI